MVQKYIAIMIATLAPLHFQTWGNDAIAESRCLRNIRQITFPYMGFEKAGESYFSPDKATLIFQAVPSGQKQYQIYTIDIATGTTRLVSTGRGACTCASFSPDGTKLIFASSHQAPDNDDQKVPGYQRDAKSYSWEFTPHMNIYQANLDGSDLVALTQGCAYHAECAYSHDGSRIVFASNETGSMNIYTMHADGSDVTQITHTTCGYNGGPFLSPDGNTIVYRADYEKKDYLQIYSIDIHGNNLKQLTHNNAVNWAPYWHPNGTVIAFTTSLHGHWRYELYLLNVKTGVEHRLTYNDTFDGLPSFSKDGTQITWTSKRGPDGTCQLFIADFIMPENLCKDAR